MNTKNYSIIVSVLLGSAIMGMATFARAESGWGLSLSGGGSVHAQGASFTTTLSLTAPSGRALDTVEGTLSFDGLTCQDVTLSSDVVAQTLPTCENPYFLVGIPGGTTLTKDLFVVRMKGARQGGAHLSVSSVDILSSGASFSREGVTNTFSITALAEVSGEATSTLEGAATDTASTTIDETSTTSEAGTTTTASTTENNFLAAVGNTLYGIPSAAVIVLLVMVLALFGGTVYYRRLRRTL